MRVGLMLYTVRDECERDLEHTIQAVSGLGYDGVELWRLHGHAPAQVRAWLDDAGLVAVGRHAGIEELENGLPQLSRELAALGTERVALSSIEPGPGAIDRIAAAAGAARAAGLALGFHNHAAELLPLTESGETFLDLLRMLPRELLWLELDLGWVWHAGADPAAELASTSGRCPLVHVKDFPQPFEPRGRPGRRRRRRLRAGAAGGRPGGRGVAGRRGGRGRRPGVRGSRALAPGGAQDAGGKRLSGPVPGPVRVGVVGCGIIARRYVEDSVAFDTWRPVACADLDPGVAQAFAGAHGLRPGTVEELVADPEVELVLNLTPPTAHAAVTRAALDAGKHVYSEKPLATSVGEGRTLVAEADRLGLRVGCAPDTFLGGAYEAGRMLIEQGEIGRPLGAAATMLVGGPDTWHPNADMFFLAGGGPLLDIAPYYLTAIVALLGPIAAVAGFAGTPTPERTLAAGPRSGESFAVEVPTHAASVLRLESGALATITVSFEARGQSVSSLQVFGSRAMLVLPDANAFGGEVILRRGDGARTVAYESRGAREARGLGLDELVEAMRAGRPHRASGALALHVLTAADALARAGAEGRTIELA